MAKWRSRTWTSVDTKVTPPLVKCGSWTHCQAQVAPQSPSSHRVVGFDVHACNAGLTDYAKRDLTTSIETILPVVKKILLPIRSKTKLIEELQKSGVGLGEAQWLTTNLRLIGQSPELYEWKMDVDVIEQLFDSFLATDLWPVVESCKESTDVALHFVRAAKNTMWTRDVLDRLDALKDHHVHHHLLEQSGHWVHIDNPNGLLKIIQPYML